MSTIRTGPVVSVPDGHILWDGTQEHLDLAAENWDDQYGATLRHDGFASLWVGKDGIRFPIQSALPGDRIEWTRLDIRRTPSECIPEPPIVWDGSDEAEEAIDAALPEGWNAAHVDHGHLAIFATGMGCAEARNDVEISWRIQIIGDSFVILPPAAVTE